MLGLDNPIHILFLLIVLLLVFGAKRLPEVGRSLGSGMRGFKSELTGIQGAPETANPSGASARVEAAAAAAPREPAPDRPIP
jgi:sec-independent protein translocase protein TatA